MKNIKYIFLLMIGLSIIGCSDLIEEPVGLLSPDGFFETTTDIQTVVDASMTHAINEEIWGRKLSCALMLRSDMVDLQSDQARRVEMNMHTISADNEMVYDPWTRIWLGIAAANTAIAGAEDVNADDEIKNPVTAQAYFIRAWYYFHLVRLFDDIPYFDAPISDTETALSVGLMSKADVYTKILADLEYAKTWLPEKVSSRAMPSKAAASSYIALVNLTMGNWQAAWDEAKEVIDNADNYDLELDPDFQSLFNADKVDDSKEPIFALDYNNVEASDNSYDQVAPMTGIRKDMGVYEDDSDDSDGGWSVMVPSMAVYESFDTLDYRTRVSFQTEAMIGDTIRSYTDFSASGHKHAANRPYIAKYSRFPGEYAKTGKRATSHNYSMMRYAEVLLIAAEAAVELGDNPSALKYVNMVRERARRGGESTNGGYLEETVAASLEPADLSGTLTADDILEERRIELAFECKRWYDIKRRQLGDVVFGASGYEGAKTNWNSAEDYDTPFPEDETAVNQNLQ